MSALPDPVRWNWDNAADQEQRATAITRNLPGLIDQVNKAKRVLADLTAEQMKREDERAEHLRNAEVSRELVAGWCAAHGVPVPEVPPPPAEIPVDETAAFPAVPDRSGSFQTVPDGSGLSVPPDWPHRPVDQAGPLPLGAILAEQVSRPWLPNGGQPADPLTDPVTTRTDPQEADHA